MTAKKTSNLEVLILKLLSEKKEISLRKIAEEAGLSIEASSNRRAIQRALTKLIERKVIVASGKARARIYILKVDETKIDGARGFKDIPLSNESALLLPYFSKPAEVRKPVGYDRTFLMSYTPNKTSYLNDSLRQELLKLGYTENITRPAGTYARHFLNRLLIDLSWNSSRLEGNTYSLLETKRLIEFGENAIGKDATEAQMIINHKDAIEYIVESANETKISAHEICSIHALLSNNLLGDPSASGRLREISVGVSGTSYLPLNNPHVIKEYFDLFIEKMNRIKDPFEQSFFSLIHLSYLQAFEDVNKRTARLVANIPLIKKNLKPLSFIDVDQQDYVVSLLGIYEKNDVNLLRDLYLWAYRRSTQQYSAMQQSLGESNSFKLKYRNDIQNIVRTIILKEIPSNQVVLTIQTLVEALQLSEVDAKQLFHLIEIEIMSLHDGNIARFRIQPSEFLKWKDVGKS